MNKALLLPFLFLIIQNAQSQTYFLNGNAVAIGNDCYTLTPAFPNMNGTVWYANQIDLNEPFDLQFTMNFGGLDANGADGICFVLQTVGTSAIGTSGGGMGYQDFGTSLGIEFDTYSNGNFNDPIYDHIGIQTNGNIYHNIANNVIANPVQASATSANIEDNQDHTVRITWDPALHRIQVFFDCEFRLEGTSDLIQDVFGGQSLVYWGFTAATGGSFNFQTVCLREDILNQTQVTICAGSSIQLEAAESNDGNYTWSPTDYLDNPQSATPTATPPTTTTYTVVFADVCGNQTQTEITVEVEPLTIDILQPETLSCVNPEVTLATTVNLDEPLQYNWFLNNNPIAVSNNPASPTIEEQGVYIVEANYNNECFASDTVTVLGDFSMYDINAGNDLTLNCINDSVTIQAITNGGSQVAWFHNNSFLQNESTLSLTTAQTGEYTVYITHPTSGCISIDTVLVNSDYSAPQITSGMQDSLTCTQPIITLQNITVNSNHPYSIQWSTNNGQIVGSSTVLLPAVAAAASYTLSVTDETTGCTTDRIIQINEASNFHFDVSQLAFPNIITPNGDATNHYWKPYASNKPDLDITKLFESYELQIFNRWGKRVFESSSFNRYWDAEGQPEGTYFYTLQFQSNCSGSSTPHTLHGTIQVAR